MAGSVKFGVLLPTRGILFAPPPPPVEDVLGMAEAVERAGYDSIWIGDSVIAKPRLETFGTLGALAARTRRVKIGTSVLLPVLRHPVLLAQAVASADILASGRLILGIGVGRVGAPNLEQEFEVCGIPIKQRSRRTEEMVELMRQLWAEPRVTYTGRYYQYRDVELGFNPVQRPGVPIWISSNDVDTGLERVGRYGDGWITNVITPEIFEECWHKVQGFAAKAGRDVSGLPRAVYMTMNVNPDGGVARTEGREFLEKYYKKPFERLSREFVCNLGSPDECLKLIEGYVQAGANYMIVRFAAKDQRGHLEFCTREILARFAR